MDHVATIQMLLADDPLRRAALEALAALDIPDCWIGAGFVRDAVWDHLHNYGVAKPNGDVDVVWYNSASPEAEFDEYVEQKLRDLMPVLRWSVKNQARMHIRNGDAPYASVSDAMRYWPETATAIAVRLDRRGLVEVNAPFGLDDLFTLRLRPTLHFVTDKLPIFIDRIALKQWIHRYPKLSIETASNRPACRSFE